MPKPNIHIVIEHQDKEIELMEYTIRTLENPYGQRDEKGKPLDETVFQAIVRLSKRQAGIFGTFSFYDADNHFLGHSSDDFWQEENIGGGLIPVQFELDVPANTATVKSRFLLRQQPWSIWDYAFQTIVALIIVLLISAIIHLWT